MTQEQALAEVEAISPEYRGRIKLERTHCIGAEHGTVDSFYIWLIGPSWKAEILASSERSWAHAVAIAKSGNEDIWSEDHDFTEPTAA